MAKNANFDLSQLIDYRDKLVELEKDMDKFLNQAARNIAARAIRKMKGRTPEDTGTLRNGWQIAAVIRGKDGIRVVITNDVPYASDVEYGHRTRSKKSAAGKEADKAKERPKAERKKGKKKRDTGSGKKTNGYVKGVYMMTIAMIEIEREMTVLLDREMQKYIRSKLG